MKNMKQLFSKHAYFLIGLSLLSFNSFASTYTVMNTNDSGTGSFRQAVLDANANPGLDSIFFDSGIDGSTITVLTTIASTDDLLITGNGALNTIISSGANLHPNGMLKVSSGSIEITGLKLTRGNTAYYGSLIDLESSGNCSIHHNSFDGNGNSDPAIMLSANTITLNIKRNEFKNGGFAIFSITSLISSSVSVKENYCDGSAGFALDFGAGNTIVVENNTIKGSDGIRIMNITSDVQTEVTITNNTIFQCYIGLSIWNDEWTGFSIENNIVYGSTNDVELNNNNPIPAGVFSNNIVGNCSSSSGACPTFYSNADPLLDPLGFQDNGGGIMTVALQAGSPAINNANTNAPVLDQRGYSRPDAADIGAYEFNGIPPCDPNNLGSFTSQPSDLSICQDESILFTYGFTGQADSIQWNLSLDGVNWFVDDPNVGDSLMVDSVDYSANGVYVMAIAYGCGAAFDSTIVVQLTVDTLNVGTSVNGITISAIQPNATYQWFDCGNGYAEIAGATAQSYTPAANGNYAVEVTNGACSDTSACVTINSVGLIESDLFAEVSIYPNPSSGETLSILSNQPIHRVQVTDMSGRIIFEQEGDAIKTINVSGLMSGEYFITMLSETSSTVIKFIQSNQ